MLNHLDNGTHEGDEKDAQLCHPPLPPLKSPWPNEHAAHWASPSFIILRDGSEGIGELHVVLGICKLVALILLGSCHLETNPFALRGPVPGPSVVIRAPMIVLAFHSLVLLLTSLGRGSHPCWKVTCPWLAFTLAFLVESLLVVLLSISIGLACWIGRFLLMDHEVVDLGL